MSFKNFILEADLKSYIPELSRLLWDDESNYSAQGTEAVNTVIQDISNNGYKAVEVMPELSLRASGTAITADETGPLIPEDKIERKRFVVNCTTFNAGTYTIKLMGCNTSDGTFVQVASLTITAAGIKSVMFSSLYKYYRVDSTVSGSIDFEAFLADTAFDNLIKFKWLELILLDRYSTENDQFFLKMLYFRDEYKKTWDRIKIFRDIDADGETTASESTSMSSITMLK